MRYGELRISTDEAGGVPVIRAEGEVDLGTVDQLRSAASEVVRGKPKRVVFDLGKVTYIDSTGLGILVATRKQLGGGPDSVVIVTEQPAVLQSLSLTGLDRIFSVVPELQAAGAGSGSRG
ncbi:MAG: STAS domain-containing protein [Armatimonadota bacterium]